MNPVEVKRKQIQMYSHIIGVITLLAVGRIIQDAGVAYLAAAVECYFGVCLLISYGAADCLGKILRSRNGKGQNKNCAGLRKNAMLLQGAVGVAGSILLSACAGPLAEHIFELPYSSLLIRLFAPAVFLRTISSVLLGYFQGEGSELPTAAACVIRQVFILGFSLLFCNILKSYGEKVSGLLGREEFTFMWAGSGAAIAVSLTEILILLFLLLVYRGSSKERKKAEEGKKTRESLWDFTRILYGSMGAFLLTGLLERLPVWFGMVFFHKNAQGADLGGQSYGVYYGQYLALCAGFLFLLCASLIPAGARVTHGLKREDQRYARNCFQAGIHMIWAKALFFAVFLAVMAQQTAGIFNEARAETLASMLRFGSSIIVFGAFAFYFKSILLSQGKKYHVAACLGIANVIFAAASALFLQAGNAGILSLVYGGVIGSALYCGLTGFFVIGRLGRGIQMVRTFCIPLGAVCGAALMEFLIGEFFTPHLGNVAAAFIGFGVSFAVYWGILLALRNFKAQELAAVQGGRLLKLFVKAVGK